MRTLDLAIFALYLTAIVAHGLWFYRRARTAHDFSAAGGRLPGLVVGLSLFGTFLSSNTFIGVPGKAYSENWNAFVFSLSLPLAAWIATRRFVPFYRRHGGLSAYEHLEARFGAWARLYAMACYLLTQLARMGAILFGVSLAVEALSGWPLPVIICLLGALVTLYTLFGGIEAVIWTDAAQSVVLLGGALLVAARLVGSVPGGAVAILEQGAADGKLSLGSFGPSLAQSTFWVVLLYGFFINLSNFGIDQSYVQRYHTARSDAAAKRSVWLAAWLYLPISLLFFFLGTALFVFYRARPERLAPLVAEVGDTVALGDRILPFFIANELPVGTTGILVAAIVAAAMSSLDTSLNSAATVLYSDVFSRFSSRPQDDRRALLILRGATLVMGVLGTATALALVGVGSLLDAWWTLSGIFAAALLGLFLLGFLSRRARSHDAVVAVVLGVLVIAWMTFPGLLPANLRSPFHTNMIIVIGTLVILGTGLLAARRHD